MRPDLAVLNFAVRGLQETEIIDSREGCQRGDQTDVWAFGGFHRANTSIMGRVHVAHLEPGTVTRKPARSKSRKPSFVRQFRQRIDLVHELRQLAAPEEVTNNSRKSLGINQLLRR